MAEVEAGVDGFQELIDHVDDGRPLDVRFELELGVLGVNEQHHADECLVLGQDRPGDHTVSYSLEGCDRTASYLLRNLLLIVSFF